MRHLIALVVLLLVGCVAVPPSPYQVARSCARNEVSTRADVHGNVYDYSEQVETRCQDDNTHRTLADSTYQRNNRQVSERVRYDDQSGQNRTRVETSTSYGNQGMEYKGKVSKETKDLSWDWNVSVSAAH